MLVGQSLTIGMLVGRDRVWQYGTEVLSRTLPVPGTVQHAPFLVVHALVVVARAVLSRVDACMLCANLQRYRLVVLVRK